MAIKTAARKTARAAPDTAAGQKIVLFDVSWDAYVTIGALFLDRHIRFTYDRGSLEIMITSFQHENWDYLLSRLVDVLTEELDLPVEGGGSTTFRKESLERGLEPNACWWLANAEKVCGKKEIDLDVDPPPDLILEIDITRGSLDRMAMYALLKVPEVWRFDGTNLTFHVLSKGKKK